MKLRTTDLSAFMEVLAEQFKEGVEAMREAGLDVLAETEIEVTCDLIHSAQSLQQVTTTDVGGSKSAQTTTPQATETTAEGSSTRTTLEGGFTETTLEAAFNETTREVSHTVVTREAGSTETTTEAGVTDTTTETPGEEETRRHAEQEQETGGGNTERESRTYANPGFD